jgi:hypothetical protein
MTDNLSKKERHLYARHLYKIALIKAFSKVDRELLTLIDKHVEKGVSHKQNVVRSLLNEDGLSLIRKFNKMASRKVNQKYPGVDRFGRDNDYVRIPNILFFNYLCAAYVLENFKGKTIDYVVIRAISDFNQFITTAVPSGRSKKELIADLLENIRGQFYFYLLIKYLSDFGFEFEKGSEIKKEFGKARDLIEKIKLSPEELALIEKERERTGGLRF